MNEKFICPGSMNIKGTPTLEVKTCPVCGGEIELFSNEPHAKCAKCGFLAYNNIQSCITWCKYAIDCVGEEKYNEMMAKLTSEKSEQAVE